MRLCQTRVEAGRQVLENSSAESDLGAMLTAAQHEPSSMLLQPRRQNAFWNALNTAQSVS